MNAINALAAALTATVVALPFLPGVRPSRAPGFVEVQATSLRPGMRTSAGGIVLSVRRAPARVWVAESNIHGQPFVDHAEAVLVTWENAAFRVGSLDRVTEGAFHPDHYVAGVVLSTVC